MRMLLKPPLPPRDAGGKGREKWGSREGRGTEAERQIDRQCILLLLLFTQVEVNLS